MPKYWGGNYFAHGKFPKVGQKHKTEKEKKKERLNDGNNNGQAMAMQARMALASCLGQLLQLLQLLLARQAELFDSVVHCCKH